MPDYKLRIHQQKRKSLSMKVTPVGVVVFIPEWLKPDSPQVQRFIRDGLQKLKLDISQPAPPEISTPDELRALLAEWAAKLGLSPGRVQFREMYRKWGSCSSRGSITLNTALCHVPKALAEYVIVHELVHLRVFNHGKAFKAMMTQHMPDWKERSKALDEYLRALMR
jgi:hypothetical protein